MNTVCDVLVAGAGVSGVAAAVASARSGARTFLVEKENFPGGVGYSGLLQNICGLYLNGDEFPSETLNGGIVREIVSRLNHLSPEKKITKTGQVYVLPYKREDLQTVFTSLCNDEPDLTVLYNASAVSVRNKNGLITGVEVSHMGELRNMTLGVLIDCSGSGIVSEMAGAHFELSPPEKIQMAGFIMRLKGLKDVDESLAIKVPYYLAEAVKRNILPGHLKFTMFSPGDSPDEGYCKISINGVMEEGREQKVRDDSTALLRYLSGKLPAFKDSYIAGTSLRVMDREGRRIRGEYVLTEDDIINAGKFDDGVVKNSWPIEIWDKRKGTIYKYVRSGDYYEIPFRCLKAEGISNLLVAGRCISVTHEALGSTRVMGTCISLGEQAGTAAAFKAKNGKYPLE
ncbi:MAG: FAD-dependent oxidoreductase [Nitrospiraceae bacterium]|nr:MAG: FAD-dependent oxidoreductase [Nitrospiraceae bacterium]